MRKSAISGIVAGAVIVAGGLGTTATMAFTGNHGTTVAVVRPVSPTPQKTIIKIVHPKPKHRHHHHVSPPAPASVPAAPVAPTASWTNCNPGTAFFVLANQSTSCSFAMNVASSYIGPGTINVFSPTTGLTYPMNCQPDGTGAISCNGGTNASVRMYVTTINGIAPPA